MASLIKPGTVKVMTKDGEVELSLTVELNININTDGVSLGGGEARVSSPSNVETKKEKFDWAIPDFEDAPKIDFGKKGE